MRTRYEIKYQCDECGRDVIGYLSSPEHTSNQELTSDDEEQIKALVLSLDSEHIKRFHPESLHIN